MLNRDEHDTLRQIELNLAAADPGFAALLRTGQRRLPRPRRRKLLQRTLIALLLIARLPVAGTGPTEQRTGRGRAGGGRVGAATVADPRADVITGAITSSSVPTGTPRLPVSCSTPGRPRSAACTAAVNAGPRRRSSGDGRCPAVACSLPRRAIHTATRPSGRYYRLAGGRRCRWHEARLAVGPADGADRVSDRSTNGPPEVETVGGRRIVSDSSSRVVGKGAGHDRQLSDALRVCPHAPRCRGSPCRAGTGRPARC